jgi:dGTPase
MSDPVYETMAELRQFLFENVYRSPRVHNEFVKAKKILTELFNYLMDDERGLQAELMRMELLPFDPDRDVREQVVCDTIASMTDRYSLNLYHRIFMPFPQF